jgi:hypothetical protein
MYLQRKNQYCIFILSVLFCSETETRYTLCTGAKSGLADDFSQKMFPITPPGNGNVGMGPRDLWEFGFKADKNSPPQKKNCRQNFSKKQKQLFGDMSILYYLSKKCEILFKNLLLNLPFFILCKKKCYENLVFFTDTVTNLAVRYTLCGHYTLCAHCISFHMLTCCQSHIFHMTLSQAHTFQKSFHKLKLFSNHFTSPHIP